MHENFYMKNGVLEHFIENYFLINPDGELKNNNWSVQENDDGRIFNYNFYWFSIDEIKNIDLKPTAIKELIINNKYKDFNYLIRE